MTFPARYAPRPPITYRGAAASDVGRVRGHNEDAHALDVTRGRYVLADGMGGHAGGEVASRLATDAAAAALDAGASPRAAIETANRVVRTQAERHPDLRGMGTTLVVLQIANGAATVAHVGDSRAYLLRGRRLRQLTTDHSMGHTLLRSVGHKATVEADVTTFVVHPGDVFLLCSDGLHGCVADAKIRRVLLVAPDPAAATRVLLDAALDAGGPDNVTVVVVQASL